MHVVGPASTLKKTDNNWSRSGCRKDCREFGFYLYYMVSVSGWGSLAFFIVFMAKQSHHQAQNHKNNHLPGASRCAFVPLWQYPFRPTPIGDRRSLR